MLSRNVLSLSKLSKTSHVNCLRTFSSDKTNRWINNLFVRKIEHVKESQSDLLADSKSVFDLQIQKIKPEAMSDFLELLNGFVKDIQSTNDNGELAGCWTVEIGQQDTVYMLWKYAGGYPALNAHYEFYRNSKKFEKFRKARQMMLTDRQNQICLPFSYWPKIVPSSSEKGQRIYEIRSYILKPGTMIEWGNHWARAIRARQQHEATCGLFSHIGNLHMVHHIWRYEDLEQRRLSRDDAWRTPGWDECVLHTVPLIRSMSSYILRPTPFSPLQ